MIEAEERKSGQHARFPFAEEVVRAAF